MGAPTQVGGTLPQQVQQAYQGAAGGFGGMAGAGGEVLGGAIPYGQQAGSVYGSMAGMRPEDVTAGQLSNTNLDPYMNPFTRGVIDTTMSELNRQEGISQLGIDDAAQRQNAFGGDRMYLQKGQLGGDFARAKASTLADLNLKNFMNAQGMGQYDITNRLQADQSNADRRAQIMGAGAQGLGNLGLGWGQIGYNLLNSGSGGLGDLAGSGFQMANAANAAQVAAAQAQQQQQQQAIDAANANYARLLGIPQGYLEAMFGIGSGMGNFGTTKGATQTDPGLLSTIGAGAGILGSIAGMPVG